MADQSVTHCLCWRQQPHLPHEQCPGVKLPTVDRMPVPTVPSVPSVSAFLAQHMTDRTEERRQTDAVLEAIAAQLPAEVTQPLPRIIADDVPEDVDLARLVAVQLPRPDREHDTAATWTVPAGERAGLLTVTSSGRELHAPVMIVADLGEFGRGGSSTSTRLHVPVEVAGRLGRALLAAEDRERRLGQQRSDRVLPPVESSRLV